MTKNLANDDAWNEAERALRANKPKDAAAIVLQHRLLGERSERIAHAWLEGMKPKPPTEKVEDWARLYIEFHRRIDAGESHGALLKEYAGTYSASEGLIHNVVHGKRADVNRVLAKWGISRKRM